MALHSHLNELSLQILNNDIQHSLGKSLQGRGPLCASPTISTAALPKPLCNPSSDLRLFGSLEFGLSTEAAPGIAHGWPSGLLGGPRSCFFSLLRCFYFSSWPSLRSRKHDVCYRWNQSIFPAGDGLVGANSNCASQAPSRARSSGSARPSQRS